MLRFGLLGLFSILFAAAAHAKPAWEVSNRWRCLLQSDATCVEGKACELQPMELLREVDFERGTVATLGLDPPHETFVTLPINSRQFLDMNSVPDGTYLHVGYYQLFLIIDDPREEAEGVQSYPFQMATLSERGSPSISFGRCTPLHE